MSDCDYRTFRSTGIRFDWNDGGLMWENYVQEEAGEAEPVDGLSDAFLSFLSLSYDVNLKLEWHV